MKIPAAFSLCAFLLSGLAAADENADKLVGAMLGDTPIIDACLLGNVEMVRLLLQHGANPNATSDTNDNPLHCATRIGNAELLHLLISNGADPNYTTDLGETIFDNWPNKATKQNELSEVLERHSIKRGVTEQSDAREPE